MQAIILAGGFGTRLKSLVDNVPKPMAEIAGRPLLGWLLEYLQSQGITEAVLCLHHLPETVQNYFGNQFGCVKLHYSIEEIPLGTGGAIARALQFLNPTQPVFALNGDSLVQLDFSRMMAHHIASNRPITLATHRVPDCRRYSQLAIENGCVQHYELYGDEGAGDISVGFYVISPHLFADYFTPKESAPAFEGLRESGFSLERDFLAPLAPELAPAVYSDVDYFIDIGVPADYERAMREIPKRLSESLVA